MKNISRRTNSFISIGLAGVLTACGAGEPAAPGAPLASRAGYDVPGTHRQYGPPITLGDGKVRTYVVLDEKSQTPLEIGVAIDARTIEGTLPGGMMMQFPLELPAQAPLPYEFVLFDWNPQGHEPPGVYDLPHFDFHFYFTTVAEVQTITPSDPDFAAKANHLPTGDFVPPFYIVPAPPGLDAAALAVPGMGVHWDDVRAPQLQLLLGNPTGWAPFTKTVIYGSWDGRLTFVEPMITRQYLLLRTDEVIPISQPARYPEPGWYPAAYRITYDAQAKEHRVGMVELSWRQ